MSKSTRRIGREFLLAAQLDALPVTKEVVTRKGRRVQAVPVRTRRAALRESQQAQAEETWGGFATRLYSLEEADALGIALESGGRQLAEYDR